jgi:hypothetical protein
MLVNIGNDSTMSLGDTGGTWQIDISHDHTLPFFVDSINSSNLSTKQPWNFSVVTDYSKTTAPAQRALSGNASATSTSGYLVHSLNRSITKDISNPYYIVAMWKRIS